MNFPKDKAGWLKLVADAERDGEGAAGERVGSQIAAFQVAIDEHRVSVTELRGYLDAMEELFPETKRTNREAARQHAKAALAVLAELAEGADPTVRASANKELSERGLTLERLKDLLRHDNEDIIQFLDAQRSGSKN